MEIINEFDGDIISTSAVVAQPWRRYFARILDSSCYGLIVIAICHLVLRWNMQGNMIETYLSSVGIYVFMLFIEPLLLSTFGTTIGKGLFGLVIRNEQGEKLTYEHGLIRTFSVLKTGLGFGIPFYSIYCLVVSYNRCKAEKVLIWDEAVHYSLKKMDKVRVGSLIGTIVLIIVLNLFILLQAQLPIHRGDITAEEYYENCNDYLKYHRFDLGKQLNNNGEWVSTQSNDGYSITLFEQSLPTQQVVTANGYVTRVILETEWSGDVFMYNNKDQMYMAIVAFVAAQKGINAFNWHPTAVRRQLNKQFENFSFVVAGVRITNEVDKSKNTINDGNYLLSADGKKVDYHMIFTMEKIN